ncbi:peptidoglycan recognition protein family protein [Streptomyces sp. MAR25Y5]|uniref:peptidoglycan recognition protein family protein n=1 Tax=Streptomyces sp. MAR25Y5 TaxID=2962028 RepID=UPI0020B7D5DD|nr:peptidoglycan recognition protein [Streptomyces sp. MAR25Y5]MCP3768964.1 peptidoglycan recognition protein [Streptomyces sp. MAR25Y5]
MRRFLASSIGVTCAAALALPLAPSGAAAAAAAPGGTAPAVTRAAVTNGAGTPGSTQSLPLQPLDPDRASGAATFGLAPRSVRSFSLVGVIWDDPAAELHGQVQVRARAADTGVWSGWQDVETHNADHAADPETAERTSGRARGATAPLWVGASDGVEIRVRAESRSGSEAEPKAGSESTPLLPPGMRLELVDPGEDPPSEDTPSEDTPSEDTPSEGAESPDRNPGEGTGENTGQPSGQNPADGSAVIPADAPRTGVMSAEATAASAANAPLAPLGATEIPALNRAETEEEYHVLRGTEAAGQEANAGGQAPRAEPYIGPRPGIVTRSGWGADESLREKSFVYTDKVSAAFVHHSASGNNYTCAQAPSVIRSIYRYHTESMGWRDIGYNFLVDKCGKIYEGRAGGLANPVLGAHTLGFNSNSMGVAVLGTFSSTSPPAAAVTGVAQLTAWKLGLHGMDPSAKTYLTSGGGNLYAKGTQVRLNVISGHRDGFNTECPGGKLYDKLGTVRSAAAGYQGR